MTWGYDQAAWNKGKHLSQSHKDAIAVTRKGKHPSQATKDRMSAAKKAYLAKLSPEERKEWINRWHSKGEAI